MNFTTAGPARRRAVLTHITPCSICHYTSSTVSVSSESQAMLSYTQPCLHATHVRGDTFPAAVIKDIDAPLPVSAQSVSYTALSMHAGFVLERIHGANSDKHVGNPAFHDITYIRQLLFSVFKSLHAAQRQLAFHHADLRLANIMEVHDPMSMAGLESRRTSSSISSTSQSQSQSFTARNSTEAPQRISLDKDTARAAPAGRSKSVNSIPAANLKAATQPSGDWSDSLTHHFKIIDYGLADFKELFGAGYVHSRSGHNPRKQNKASQGLFRGTSLGKMAVPVKVIDSKDVDPADKEYMRSARPVGCVALLPHPSKLLPQVALGVTNLILLFCAMPFNALTVSDVVMLLCN